MIGSKKQGPKSCCWSPQPGPQKDLIDCPVYEIFYGGARGGGKTDGVLGKMGIKAAKYGPGFNAIFFRKELPMLDDAISRSQQIYAAVGAKWQDQKKTWKFPNGGRLRFRPLERLQDAEKYQGQNLSDVCIEEAGNYPTEDTIRRLHGVLRSAAGVPTQMHLTGNPGGPGQHWIKARYIDPDPRGYAVINEELANGKFKQRVFIPAKVTDNKILMANDPDYVSSLYMVGSSALVKAWLDGDWSAIEGAYFDCWSSDIIVDPCRLPNDWVRFISFDWGSARPFSVGWWAVSEGTKQFPAGSLVRYREWYGASGPNKGLKLTAEEVGQGIKERTNGDDIHYAVADPAVFTEDGGPSIAERMFNTSNIAFGRADNKRVARNGALGGWDQLRNRMKGENGRPMIYCFATCTDSIRTIPTLQHDKVRAEDLDTESEDHAADEWRYGAMSRPYTMPEEQNHIPVGKWDKAFSQEGEVETWRTT